MQQTEFPENTALSPLYENWKFESYLNVRSNFAAESWKYWQLFNFLNLTPPGNDFVVNIKNIQSFSLLSQTVIKLAKF